MDPVVDRVCTNTIIPASRIWYNLQYHFRHLRYLVLYFKIGFRTHKDNWLVPDRNPRQPHVAVSFQPARCSEQKDIFRIDKTAHSTLAQASSAFLKIPEHSENNNLSEHRMHQQSGILVHKHVLITNMTSGASFLSECTTVTTAIINRTSGVMVKG